jgi:23S rRNA (guanosine2251-2'-O)-methyltransferase
MAGGVSSLNVSAAGAVVLYEAARQRRAAANSPAKLVQKAAARSAKGLGS